VYKMTYFVASEMFKSTSRNVIDFKISRKRCLISRNKVENARVNKKITHSCSERVKCVYLWRKLLSRL